MSAAYILNRGRKISRRWPFPTFKQSSFSFATVNSSSPPHFPAPVSSQSEDNSDGGWKNLLLFTPGAVAFGLGTWQVFRRQDKIEELNHRQLRLDMDPVMLNQATPLCQNQEPLEFRKVMCKGHFDEKMPIYLGPRSRSISGITENGYYLIMPFVPVPDTTERVPAPAVLVNRGWVPHGWKGKPREIRAESGHPSSGPSPQADEGWSLWRPWPKRNKKAPAKTEGAAEPARVVVGVVRNGENPSIFVPLNDPTSSQWFYVDVPAMARALTLPDTTVYLEEIRENADPGNPYPLPKDISNYTRSPVMPRDHLNYTFTWYALSIAVTYMAFKRLKPGKSRGSKKLTNQTLL